jgi:hypothetical protein
VGTWAEGEAVGCSSDKECFRFCIASIEYVERVWVDLRGVVVFVPRGGLYYNIYSKQDCTNSNYLLHTSCCGLSAGFGISLFLVGRTLDPDSQTSHITATDARSNEQSLMAGFSATCSCVCVCVYVVHPQDFGSHVVYMINGPID